MSFRAALPGQDGDSHPPLHSDLGPRHTLSCPQACFTIRKRRLLGTDSVIYAAWLVPVHPGSLPVKQEGDMSFERNTFHHSSQMFKISEGNKIPRTATETPFLSRPPGPQGGPSGTRERAMLSCRDKQALRGASRAEKAGVKGSSLQQPTWRLMLAPPVCTPRPPGP